MSKLDAQRAMREAKYGRDHAAAASRREAAAVGDTPTAPAAPRARSAKPARATEVAPAVAVPAAATEGERCGHKSMNGRACTREAGHSEKSHRYS